MNNIANANYGVNYVKYTNQDVVIMWIDTKKAFVTIQWSFLEATMYKMGFEIPKVIYWFDQNSFIACTLDGEIIDL